MMLAFEIKPVDFAPDLVELVLSPVNGVKTSIVLSRVDLATFSTNLKTKASMIMPSSCALLQKTKMVINNE
jgi:hypothetical protein